MGSDFRDRHKGSKCYIFGCGPSLNRFDCDKLAQDGLTIACNASIMALKSCDYYFFTDPRVEQDKAYFATIFDKAKTVVAGNADIFALLVRFFGQGNIDRVELPSPKRGDRWTGVDFSPDKLIAGETCVEVAAHLAHMMGCSSIILVGVDLKMDGDRKYFYDRTEPSQWAAESPTDEGSLVRAYNYWSAIKSHNPGLPIFVANKDSRLCDFYPWIDLTAFEKA